MSQRYVRVVTSEEIESGLTAINCADSQITKHLLLAALCTKVFAERGVDVVVLRDCATISGDIELYAISRKHPSPLERQKIMGQLGAKGGSHSWQVVGTRVTLVMGCECDPKSSIRRVGTPLGEIAMVREEELFV